MIFDDTDNLAGGSNFRSDKPSSRNGLIIQFYHVPTIKKNLGVVNSDDNGAAFKAFLTNFKDNFKVNWNEKETFGRMDAIQTYKNTQRSINLSFDVPSFSFLEAKANFLELQKLIRMQYPVYEETGFILPGRSKSEAVQKTTAGPVGEDGQVTVVTTTIFKPATKSSSTLNRARFISSPPLIYVKFNNWISSDPDLPGASQVNSELSNVLCVVISDVSFSPDLDEGVHISTASGNIIPKLFKVELNMKVIHTQELGWVDSVQGSNIDQYLFGEPQKPPSGQSGKFADYLPFPYRSEAVGENKTIDSQEQQGTVSDEQFNEARQFAPGFEPLNSKLFEE